MQCAMIEATQSSALWDPAGYRNRGIVYSENFRRAMVKGKKKRQARATSLLGTDKMSSI